MEVIYLNITNSSTQIICTTALGWVPRRYTRVRDGVSVREKRVPAIQSVLKGRGYCGVVV